MAYQLTNVNNIYRYIVYFYINGGSIFKNLPTDEKISKPERKNLKFDICLCMERKPFIFNTDTFTIKAHIITFYNSIVILVCNYWTLKIALSVFKCNKPFIYFYVKKTKLAAMCSKVTLRGIAHLKFTFTSHAHTRTQFFKFMHNTTRFMVIYTQGKFLVDIVQKKLFSRE